MNDAPDNSSETDPLVLLRMESAELHEHRKALADYVDELSRSLIPYYTRRRELRNEINQTHDGDWRDADFIVTGLRLDRAVERVDIWPELDRLNAEHVEPIRELQNRRAALRLMDQQIARIEKSIEKEKAKQGRRR